MEIATAYKSDRTVIGHYKDMDTAIGAMKSRGYELMTRNDYSATMERGEHESAFAPVLNPEYGPYTVPAESILIEMSRVSGL